MTNKEFNYPAITHSCDRCGAEFQVACFSELQEKLRKHKCHPVNKKVVRTAAVKQARIDDFIHDTTMNRLEEHNFNKLVNTGMVVREI